MIIKKQTKIKKYFLGAFKFLGFFLVFSVCFILFLFIYYGKDLPRPEDFTERKFIQSTKIYDAAGESLLYEIFEEEKREYTALDLIPEHLIQAVMAAEDRNFYEHSGVDLKAIVRAFFTNLKLVRPAYGGSTISQQLIRSTFFTTEKTLERKIKEVILSLELERKHPKDQILEWYLNQIPFGGNAYGVKSASQTYFRKPIEELELEESAILAALIKAPSYYSPWGRNKPFLIQRAHYILGQMEGLGFISQEEKNQAIEKEIAFSEIPHPLKAPHFSLYVRDWLLNKYGEEFLAKNGLKVYTSLDYELQEIAEAAVREGTERNTQYNANNAALTAICPKTGRVLAMVGSKDWFGEPFPENCSPGQDCLFDPKVNISFALRQPGSAFKPFVYAAAFQKGYTPNTILWDVRTEFNVNCSPNAAQNKDKYGLKCYHPSNYDNKFRGTITLRESLAQSVNITSVKILYLTGVAESINLAKNLGITTLTDPSKYGLSLVLGGGAVKLIDMVSAFSVLANEGIRQAPIFVLKIEDADGNIIFETENRGQRVLDAQTSRQINDVLSDNAARAPMFGARSNLYFEGYDVAAKTGTSQDYRDAWTMGYNPSIAVGVWVGNNNNVSINRVPGAAVAAPIFHNFLSKALAIYPKENFNKPEIVWTGKSILDGKLPWGGIEVEKNTESENGNIKDEIIGDEVIEDELKPKIPHSILHYVDKNDPAGPIPENPAKDPLYFHFEEGVKSSSF